MSDHILITGGAGYIGSLLTGELLCRGYKVTVVDELLFGGDLLISYFPNPKFPLFKTGCLGTTGVTHSITQTLAEAQGGGAFIRHCRFPRLSGCW